MTLFHNTHCVIKTEEEGYRTEVVVCFYDWWISTYWKIQIYVEVPHTRGNSLAPSRETFKDCLSLGVLQKFPIDLKIFQQMCPLQSMVELWS